MSSTYSNSLRVELIGSGDQAGTWGTTTDNNFAYIFDSAIAGINTVTVTSANQALTYVNGPVSTPALNQSIYAILKFNSAAAASAIYAPPVSKQYIIWNNSSFTITIYNSTVIGNTTAAGTGVAITAGSKVMVWSDGTNFYDVQASGTVAVANGGTGQTSYTNGQLLIGNTTGNTLTKTTLTAGSGITITNGSGAITIASSGGGGSVTSVSGTGSANGISLSGTVTSSGNLTLGGALSSITQTVSLTDEIGMYTGAATGFIFGNTSQGYPNAIIPPNPSTYTLGRSGQQWSTIYIQTAAVVGSDERDKIVLGPTLGLDFITRLEAVQYKLKLGGYDVKVIPDTNPPEFDNTPIPGRRIHYGMLAQQVKSVIDELQLPDFGGWVSKTPADPEAEQALRYEEFIAPMIKSIQELKALVDAQAARITALESR
jgi:hypothetical protein